MKKTLIKSPKTISPEQARILALQGQGLLNQKSKASAHAIIENLGYVQIDTLWL